MTEQNIREDYEAALLIASEATGAQFEQACVLIHRIADQADEFGIDIEDINRRFDNGE